MNPRPLFQGELVRLGEIDLEEFGEAFARWSLDAEFNRLLDSSPSQPRISRLLKEEMEKNEDKEGRYRFGIRTLTDDHLIGCIELDGIYWSHGSGWVAIAIGHPDFRGKGYGTDAMKELLRFAFTELNLFRINLDVFEYNPRAIRSYEKAGFVYEGRLREALHRDGRYWDTIYMGILGDDWRQLDGG